MSKGLEALEKICSKGCDYCDKWHCEHNLLCKTELGGCYKCGFYGNEKETIENELKALEIIKEKLIDIDLFFYCANKSMYNNRVNIGKQLTDEEYDLLKEVLL